MLIGDKIAKISKFSFHESILTLKSGWHEEILVKSRYEKNYCKNPVLQHYTELMKSSNLKAGKYRTIAIHSRP